MDCFDKILRGSAKIRLCVLASGSKGNATYIESGSCAVLIDCGVSRSDVYRRMAQRGLDPRKLSAIAVSHEHHDHIAGVGPLARHRWIPVFMNQGTMEKSRRMVGESVPILNFFKGKGFEIDGLRITSFGLSHDGCDTVGFVVTDGFARIGIASDLGHVTGPVREALAGCEVLVLESNHDVDMLFEGPYPWPTKQRIVSRLGHLSNEDSAELIGEVYHKGLLCVVLAHLSQVNNTPERALEEAERALRGRRHKPSLRLGFQDSAGEVIDI